MLLGLIPIIAKKFQNVSFIIGGGGSKLHILKEMVKIEELHSRVEILGELHHSEVKKSL